MKISACNLCGDPVGVYEGVALHVRTQEPNCGYTDPPSQPDDMGFWEDLSEHQP